MSSTASFMNIIRYWHSTVTAVSVNKLKILLVGQFQPKLESLIWGHWFSVSLLQLGIADVITCLVFLPLTYLQTLIFRSFTNSRKLINGTNTDRVGQDVKCGSYRSRCVWNKCNYNFPYSSSPKLIIPRYIKTFLSPTTAGNALTGTVPTELGGLTKLEDISLGEGKCET